MRSSQRVKGVIVVSKGEGEDSGSRVRSRVRVMCSIRSTGEIGLQLEFGSTSDVRFCARISLRFKDEVSVTSMTKMKCQILAPGIGLALVVR